MQRLFPILFVLFLSGAAQAETPPRDTHERLHSVLWIQTSPEYQVACNQVFNAATAQLTAALEDPFWTAATEQTGNYSQLPTAVVFDIDETVLDNSPFQARLAAERIDYLPKMWDQWCSEAQADALPGAKRFVKVLRARGVTPIFVSNRHHKFHTATYENLKRELDYPDLKKEQVLLQGINGWTSDKTSRREVVAKDYRILFLVGDVYDDFIELHKISPEERKDKAAKYASRWGKMWFLLPNPAYGNWERAIYDYGKDKAVLKRKFEALQLKR